MEVGRTLGCFGLILEHTSGRAKRLSQNPKGISDYVFKKQLKNKGETPTVCLYVMVYIKCRRTVLHEHSSTALPVKIF